VAFLPGEPDHLVWSPEGKAFLTLDGSGRALRLGTPETGALWDVEALLSNASAFTWRVVAQE
jgi:hypothetical protein